MRKQRGMTLEELSAKTGITAAHLSLIERDKRDPSIQTLNKIAKALEVDTEVFWWNTVETPSGKNAEYDLVRCDERKIYRGVYNDKLTYEYVTNSAVYGPKGGRIYGRLYSQGGAGRQYKSFCADCSQIR